MTTLADKKKAATELAKKIGAEMKATIGGHSFYFIKYAPSTVPKEAVAVLAEMRRDIEASRWTVIHVGTPRPQDNGTTYLEVTATMGARCEWGREKGETLRCSFASVTLVVGKHYCYRHANLAARPPPAEEDRRTARPQGIAVEGCVKCDNEGAPHDGDHVFAGQE